MFIQLRLSRRCITARSVLLAVHLFLLGFYLRDYLAWDSAWFLAGLAAFPLLVTAGPPRTHYGYGMAAVFFLALCYPIPVKTFLFFSLSFAIFFLLEASGFRLGMMAWINLVLLSPVFSAAAQIFSFPLRLRLTETAGAVLRQIEPSASVQGNVIQVYGSEFSVDPACMGLNMLNASLLLALLLLGLGGRKWGLRLKGWAVLAFLGLVFLLNLASNFIRILLLVLFRLMPDTPLHEAVGLLCLVLYVLLPSVFLARTMLRRWGQKASAAVPGSVQKAPPLLVHLVLLAALLPAQAWIASGRGEPRNPAVTATSVPGYRLSVYGPGILKLENQQSLVYVKRLRGFYDSEHNPMLCWSGSGYVFREVREEQLGSHSVYMGLLTNGQDRLYSAWWYDNGRQATNRQWDWRLGMLQGQPPYSIVNVSAETEESLKELVNDIFAHRRLSPVLGQGN